jgi:hypothetical protein
MALCKILLGCPVVQSLVRSNAIINRLPLLKGLVKGSYLQIPVIYFIEFLSVRPMGPLHVPVEFRGSRWQDKEADPLPPASLLKHCLKLGTSIHLQRLNPEGHPLNNSV